MMLLLSAPASGQALVFCERVSQNGTVTGAAHNFFIAKNGSAVDFFVRAHGVFNCSHITIDLYRLSGEGNEKFDRSVGIDVQPYDRWTHRKIVFSEASAYAVYAYDESGRLIGAGRLNLLLRN